MEVGLYCKTPVGYVSICSDGESITRLHLGKLKGMVVEETHVIARTITQLTEYFEGKRTKFDLPLSPKGTVFQKKVWEALQKIPYGQTRSYKEIAKMVGNEKAVRAVGMANRVNQIAIIIPCHRVIGSDGSLTGYAGGLKIKQRLLCLEKEHMWLEDTLSETENKLKLYI